ncbi:uncharacterized protein LOC143061451 [Mytilus galloprovincialis]|uniref:uncharacterized protein LOC143061451 n=1 Tax=Mytilus galloprovincialis TaxID=29158 RepID=UPI003F7C168D
MNLCNFVKTIIARATKDQTALDYWETHQNKPNELPNSPEKLVPKFNTNFSVSKRFISYSNIMKNYSKMQINQEKFRLLLPRIQKYVTQNTKWKNGNTNGQKQLFINTFSIYQWMKLSEKDKAKHTLTDCEQCMVFDASLLHKSSEVVKKDSLVGACQNVANIILEKSPPMSKAAEKNVENFVKVFTPIASQKLGVDIIKTVSKVMKLTPKKSKSQKTKTATKILKRNNIKIKNKLSSNGQDVRHFLASGKSFRKHDNDRMSMYFVTKAEAQQKLKVKIEKQKNALLKPKKHYGNFDHYTFEKEEFLSALRQFPHGSHVNWKKLGEQFNLTNKKGERPANAGQILMGFAQYNKINTDQFNINMRVSNRDYIQRVRRAKKRLSKGLTIPSTRSAKTIRQDIKHQIDNGVIDLGEKIAPSQISSNYIDNTGRLM